MNNEYLFVIPIAISLILGAMSPGPSFLMVAQTAVTKSRVEGVAMAGGTASGAATFAILASAGLYVVLKCALVVYRIEGLWRYLLGLYCL